MSYTLDVRQSWPVPCVFSVLRALVESALASHGYEYPDKLIISPGAQRRYLASGLSRAPWKAYRGIPIEELA